MIAPPQADSIRAYVTDLSLARIGRCVNPYAEIDCDRALDRPGAAALRRINLREYLTSRQQPRLLLVGEAPGYRGCRFSGIAFTSERSLPSEDRTSTDPRGWIEPSASIVHGALATLGIEESTALANAVPLHPAAATPPSNRTPTAGELEVGRIWLERLINLLEPQAIAAVGRHAGAQLALLGYGVPVLRHPANGGAVAFRAGLAELANGMPTSERAAA